VGLGSMPRVLVRVIRVVVVLKGSILSNIFLFA